ncbi:histidinol-phosphate transaminase [Marinobacterium sp. YM272]|uniref:histidinol-phosphate transaminase n=1 Tax=Marinobacterium sp. YM272 TaxID=3421654 RepID=UPI003D7FCB03
MSFDLYSLASAGVSDLAPYRPGKPAAELERELGLTDIVSLASNENPLGPSPAALQAATAALSGMTRYPDAAGFRLKAALRERFGLASERLTLGNGSNELISLAARVFVRPGEQIIYSEYSFIAYALAARFVDAEPVVVPAKDAGHDLDAMAAAIGEKTRLIFLANPNNPTGTWFTREQLVRFMDAVPPQVLVVLDEAYTEYVDPSAGLPDGLSLIDDYANLIVLRTFSKAYGLAGLRVGFAVADPAVTDLMNRVRDPFNVNSAALAAAEAALFDSEHLQKTLEVNRKGVAQLSEGFSQLGLGYLPTQGNFLLLDLKRPAQPVFDALLREGVIPRPLAPYGLNDHLRVTVGLAEENRRLLVALEKVLAC